MNENFKTGMFAYKGIAVLQHENISQTFSKLFLQVLPTQILEIGTSHGGLTILLRDLLDSLNLKETLIRTYDIHSRNYIKHHNKDIDIEVLTKNLFNSNYSELLESEKEDVVNFIQKPGVTIVLCDGGSKKDEFKIFADHLKVNDIIMAHDYAPSREYFLENNYNKIWNWCEISDLDINESCEKNKLNPFLQEDFLKTAWVCRKKVN
jgi:hypothetical protein